MSFHLVFSSGSSILYAICCFSVSSFFISLSLFSPVLVIFFFFSSRQLLLYAWVHASFLCVFVRALVLRPILLLVLPQVWQKCTDTYVCTQNNKMKWTLSMLIKNYGKFSVDLQCNAVAWHQFNMYTQNSNRVKLPINFRLKCDFTLIHQDFYPIWP